MEIGLLGPLEVRDSLMSRRVGGLKQRALLIALAIRANRVVPADQIIDEIWEGHPPPTAETALRVHIARVRTLLGHVTDSESHVAWRHPGYLLVIDPESLDTHRFEESRRDGLALLEKRQPDLALVALERALALWRGEALADVRDMAFALTEARRLDELHVSAQEAHADALLLLGKDREAISALEPLIAEHPLRERFVAQLMIALFRTGRQAEALRAYQRAREVLGEELGLDPGEDLRQIEAAVLAHDLPALTMAIRLVEPLESVERHLSAPWPASHVLPRPLSLNAKGSPLFGRTAELIAMHEWWPPGDSVRVAQLIGPPGIGKTYLAGAFAREIHALGGSVLYGRADRQQSMPYAAFVDALSPDIFRAVDETERFDLAAQRLRLFEDVAATISSNGRPVLFILDDGQWADAPSVALLRHLTLRRDDLAMLLLVLCRDGELRPTDPASAWLAELATIDRLHHMAVTGLDEESVAQLCGQMLPAPMQARAGELGHLVHVVTDGNPFFSREVIRHLEASGSLSAERLPDRLPLPDSVREVVSLRLATLSAECRQLLKMGSIFGRRFDVELAGLACGLDEDQLVDAIDEAVMANLVVEDPAQISSVTFSHALLNAVLYESMSRSVRARGHRNAAEILTKLGSEADLGEVARHMCAAVPLVEGGQAVLACRSAGDQAMERLGFEQAASFYRQALDTAEWAKSYDEMTRGELLLLLGRAEAWSGHHGAARESFQAAAEVARRTSAPDLLARAALGFEGFGHRVRPTSTMIETLREAAAAGGGVSDEVRVRVLARLATELTYARLGTTAGRIDFANRAVALSVALRPWVRARALYALHVTLSEPGSVRERANLADQVVSLAREAGERGLELAGMFARFVDSFERGEIHACTVQLGEYIALARTLRRPVDLWLGAIGQASLAAFRGELNDAEQLALEAAAIGDRFEIDEAGLVFAVQLFVIRWTQGRLAEMAEPAVAFAAQYPEMPAWELAAGLSLATSGDIEAGRKRLRSVMAEPRLDQYRHDWLWPAMLVAAAELAVAVGDADIGRVLASELMPFSEVNMRVGTGLVGLGPGARLLGELALLAGDVPSALRWFGSAEAAGRRMGCRLWLERTCAGRARAHALSERAG
ncbi:MAG: Transcriptional regulator, putative ATPase, winged helix family [Acidimicrobiales bacterium]|nr:Transcriptional regulator, putative ATPase, winged helix family [Acidimicrobiales bacterium]